MGQKKISQLPSDTSPTVTDSIPTLDAETSLTKKVLISDLANLLTATILPSGVMTPYSGQTAPLNWLLCYGQTVSRSTYSALFATISPSLGTFTTTIATPGVMTLTGHGLQTGDQVYLTTTGALPTGLTANTLYYAVRIDANTFSLSTSRANAYAATKIATSGTQSGTHTIWNCPFGNGDGSTTFTIPDTRGRVLAGGDIMGGTAASRLTLAQSQGVYANVGASGGEQGHQLTTAELASHTHTYNNPANSGGQFLLGGGGSPYNITNSANTGSTGSDTSHNNVQPTLLTNYIIKT